MKIIPSTFTALILIISSVAIASPQQTSGHGDYKACKHKNGYLNHSRYETMAEKLAFTDEQKEKISSLRTHKIKIMKSLRKEMLALQVAFFQLKPQSPDYKKKVFEIADKKGLLVKRMIIEKGEMRFLVTSLLTPEQRTKRQELLSAKPETTKEAEKKAEESTDTTETATNKK